VGKTDFSHDATLIWLATRVLCKRGVEFFVNVRGPGSVGDGYRFGVSKVGHGKCYS
jgi:hypothetical protein